MALVEARILGNEALTYLESRLKRGLTLSSMLLERLELASGTVWTWLPPQVSDERAGDLQDWPWDGFPGPQMKAPREEERKVAMYEAPFNFLAQFLARGPGWYLVLEAIMNDPPGSGSPFASGTPELAAQVSAKGGAGLLFYPESRPGFHEPARGEVYIYVAGASQSVSRVEEIVLSAQSHLLTGVVTKLPPPKDQLHPNMWITKVELESIARRTRLLLVDAYDGTGYLAWARPNDLAGLSLPPSA